MGVYEVHIDSGDLDPFSEMGNRELSTWRGLKNKSLRGRHLTDGSILIDKKHVTGEELLEKLKDRKSDDVIENDRIKSLVSKLKSEDQWVGKVRGQRTASRIGGIGDSVKAKWIGVVGYRNYKHHVIADAQQIQIVEKLFDAADLKVGNRGTLTWWRYGVPVGAVASWSFFDANVT